MKYLIKVQFYNPDSIPTAHGTFTVEAENMEQAKIDLAKQLAETGDYTVESVEQEDE